MTHWYPLAETDASFFDSAPLVFQYRMKYAARPERVWESLASDASISAWGSAMIKELTWLSSRPFGVGTTREVVLRGGLRVHERFIRWEEGRGYAFVGYEANLPGLRRLAEDYAVEPGDDGTWFTWKVAIEPRAALSLPFRLMSPALRAAVGRIAKDGERYFAKPS